MSHFKHTLETYKNSNNISFFIKEMNIYFKTLHNIDLEAMSINDIDIWNTFDTISISFNNNNYSMDKPYFVPKYRFPMSLLNCDDSIKEVKTINYNNNLNILEKEIKILEEKLKIKKEELEKFKKEYHD